MEAAAAEPRVETVWEAQPKQAAFISCPIDDVVFGGARGGGKSDAVIGDWISHDDRYHEHAIGMAFRRERTQLVELIERAKQVLIPLGFRWKESPDKFFLSPHGSRLRFTYLENDTDADNYQGHSYTRLYPEEMGTFPEESPINRLMATLRSGSGVPCQMKGTCNPGGAGHGWVKQRYAIDRFPRGYEVLRFEFKIPGTQRKVEKTRIFIPSKIADNHYLGDEYVANLYMVGNDALVKAWLEGDWSVVAGAFFPEFSTTRHVLRPFHVPANWTRFRAMDWGSAKPFCVGWYAVVSEDYILMQDGERVVLPRGALVKYREWYGSPNHTNVGLKMTAEEVAEGILGQEFGPSEPRDLKGENGILYGVADPSAFAEDGGPSIVERMADESKSRIMFTRADNRRVSQKGAMGGWDMLRQRLKGEGGRPMIYFFSTCVDTIRTLPNLQHDQLKPEDVDTEAEDHAGDETRYACMSRPFIRQDGVPPKELVVTVGGPTTVNLEELFEWTEKAGQGKLGGRI